MFELGRKKEKGPGSSICSARLLQKIESLMVNQISSSSRAEQALGYDGQLSALSIVLSYWSVGWVCWNKKNVLNESEEELRKAVAELSFFFAS